MFNELEFSMKKIHIARNLGLGSKNSDTTGKQKSDSEAWDTGEGNVLRTCVTPCSDKVMSSPLERASNNGKEGSFLPEEYIERFLHNMNDDVEKGSSVHDKDTDTNRDFGVAKRHPNDVESTARANNPGASGDRKSSSADSDVPMLDKGGSGGANEPNSGKEPEIINFAIDYGLRGDVHRSQDEDVSCGERGKLVGVCKVCGDHATGMYFGALVCVPCKTFFLRYANDGNSFVCKAVGGCQISTATRTQCKFCRYQKCVQAGMRRRVRPAQVKLNEGQQLCVVCSDVGNGVHFGALTCEGCKKFFRRGLAENGQYACKSGNNCVINPQTRNSCRYCRYQKCLEAGMCREAIQMGRPSKIPSSGGNRSSADRQQLLLCPVNRNPDSSSKEEEVASFERVQMGNLTKTLKLAATSENWLNEALFGSSFLHLKNGRSISLSSSEESQVDLENSSNEHVQGQSMLVSHPSSNSDLTQQPDSTVLSPAEMNHMDELEEPFLLTDNSSAPKSLKPKEQFLMHNEIKTSLGRRANISAGEDFQQSQDKRKRTEPEGCSSRIPERLPMRLHNGGKVSERNQLDLLLEAKQQKINWSLLGSGGLASSLMKANKTGADVRSLEQLSRTLTAIDCTTTDHGSESCSSPSITSSLSSDTFQKEKNGDESVNSSVMQTTQIDGVTVDNASVRKFDLETLVAKSRTYWLQPCLPDPNILFAGAKHWDVLNSIVPAYDRFLQMSNAINRTLKAEFEEWSRQVTDPLDNQTFLSEWIKHKVIPAYTIASVTYCKSLPGFLTFHCDDQRTIIRFGQSPSRILMAALNWYDADQKNFRNFLSWREKKVGQLDLFKQKLIEYAEDISSLEVDAIEAALLNVLLILATDYPDLVRADVISDARWKILSTFRAYTTGKCGTPNNRVESLFSHIPELRRLGLLHHMMMTTRTMTAEEVEYLTTGRILDSKMVLSCQPNTDS